MPAMWWRFQRPLYASLGLALLMLGACQSGAAVLQLEQESFTFAPGLSRTSSQHVRVHNSSQQPLELSVSSQASWLRPELAKTRLSPNEHLELNLEVECAAEQVRDETLLELRAGTHSRQLRMKRVCEPYDIDLQFAEDAYLSLAARDALTQAAARWSRLIAGGLPDTKVDKPRGTCGLNEPAFRGEVDDLLIFVDVKPLDGERGVLGQAGPCLVRGDHTALPVFGVMVFDAADIMRLESEGRLYSALLHEMGHVLGIGTYWDVGGHLEYRGRPQGRSCAETEAFSAPPHFKGQAATRSYRDMAGRGAPPVEEGHGKGTRCGHWDEAHFGHELMTGFLGAGENPLSVLSAASLSDIGYSVDLSQVDAYRLPNCAGGCVGAQSLGSAHADTVLPRARVTEQGLKPLSP